MKLADILEYVGISFTADRFKTLMSSLGIIIGVMAIVVMLSVGEGLYSGVFSQFSQLNLDVIHVIPGTFSAGEHGPPTFRSTEEPARFTDNDVRALEGIAGIKQAAPRTSTQAIIQFRNKNASISLTAVSPKKEDDLWIKVAVGRFLTDSDDKAIVIGNGVSENLFRMKISPGNKIGLYNKDNYQEFKVVGVLEEEKESTSFGNNPNTAMYVTHKAMKDFLGEDNYYYDTIEVTAQDPAEIETVVDRIKEALKRYHKNEAFSAITARSMLSSLESILTMIKYALGGIGAVSLLVGGIGISNVMMLTVKDRIREIGVMKALGATTADIRRQYILEAGVLGLVSSLIGILLGSIASIAIGSLGGLPSLVTLQSIAIGVMFGIFTTTIAGVYPANKAAKLDPIEALRAE
ncbi:MAG: ABC transporter permease [Methanotrichaceae archaeon]|nr:ABC transporter permease [Methanotrichaceae archaeon]